MKNVIAGTFRKTVDKGRPDYYLTPTHDFTRYTKDCEEKYWNKETAFDWSQDVWISLKGHLENLDPEDFSNVTFMVLPMVKEALERKMVQIRQEQLPLDEDALKDIAECIPSDKTTIHQAILILSPMKMLQGAVSKHKDQLEMLQRALLDLKEQQRLGYFNDGSMVRPLKSEAEKEEQSVELSQMTNRLSLVEGEYKQLRAQCKIDAEQLKTKIRKDLDALESQVMVDLEETRELLLQTLASSQLPSEPRDLARLKDLVLKRQIRGLKDIANHALVVEQSAIAPLTMGIIHYKRYREIQEAMTTFINDEAKHSATFRRFLVEKLEAKEYISSKLIRGAGRYMWLARFMPGAGMFMAVIVEAIGAAYLEFFGNEKYMPDKLFCKICKTISTQDERRHMDLCVAMYNELFRKGHGWERLRNQAALMALMKSVYGDKNEDHHLIQAFRAFGVESETLYRHIVDRLSHQLARVSMFITPERLLEILGRK